MMWVNSRRVVRFGLVNFWRNRWLSLASVLVLALTLITITISIIQNIDIRQTTASIRDRLDIIVYFDDKVTEAEIKDIQLDLQSRVEVKSVVYVSKEEALKIWQDRPNPQKIKDLVTPEDNPLPRSIQIKTYEDKSLKTIAQVVESPALKDKIRRVSYKDNNKLIEGLVAKNEEVLRNGLASSVTFVIISLIVIINTIRTIILTRKEEIEIMRLVGASDYFIRAPFIVEAMITAIMAAVLSIAFLMYGTLSEHPIIPSFSSFFGDTESNFKMLILDNLGIIFTLQLVFVFLLTVITTFISMRRYLRT